jgi:hypothetical protein
VREQGIVLHGEDDLFGGPIDRVYRHDFFGEKDARGLLSGFSPHGQNSA